ncbi:uncharacterized protein DSM5745_08730 [Aspergillus mulundensis]|uniref:Uncharacterized protein n=1 Tax=Aspergillus mulundensis TaxID=1810919 RepID=A0A3D8R4S8_9EURO|nr:hypothetical protein DSM5745_08730 [Aspergillus mulundensis]RDW68970.1 hypothetical protein DSM5745_08730 [Aspergillus mulundensis]
MLTLICGHISRRIRHKSRPPNISRHSKDNRNEVGTANQHSGTVRHNGDQHVVLLVEGARVQVVPGPEKRKAHVRKENPRSLTNGVGEELNKHGLKSDTGLTNAEQLVDEGDDDHKSQPDYPGPDGAT